MTRAKPKKERTKTVFKGVYERGIGTASPYFQVRIRHKGEKHETQRFPYLPPDARPRDRDGRANRETALNEAIKAAAQEKASFHFYGKPRNQVADEQTLRDWITAWKSEACDLIHPATGDAIVHLTPRAGGKEDGKQVLRLIQISDDYAQKHKRVSIMDKFVVDLKLTDFTGPHGLLNIMTGRKAKGDPGPKPRASAGTQKRALALLSTIWKHARKEWDMDVPRPWRDAEIKGTKSTQTTRALSLAECHAVEGAISKTAVATRAAIYFLRWTAARAGEMQKLRWEHITWPDKRNGFNHPIIKFSGTKTPKQGSYRERDIPANVGALAALKMMYDPKHKGLKPPKAGIVFPAPNDLTRPLSRDTAYQAFQRAIRRAGVPHARLHDLRHTRTTELSAGLSKAQAMQITGHTDPRTFMRYIHKAEDTAEAIEQVDLKLARRAERSAEKKLTHQDIIDALKTLTPEEQMRLIAKVALNT